MAVDWKSRGLQEGNCSKCAAPVLKYRILPTILCADCSKERDVSTRAERNKRWALKHPDRAAARLENWKNKNPDRVRELAARYNNSEKGQASRRKRDSGKVEEIRKYQAAWHKSNSPKRIARYATDLNYKLKVVLRSRISMAVKKRPKKGSAVNFLGCSIDHFVGYIEGKFKDGMSWSNWSRTGWHLDHVRPLSSFDLTDATQVAVACHYTNIQPLWAVENISKGARIA